MALHLGLDVGTQGCKAVVYDADQNKVVSRGAYQYGILQSNVPGRAEQHPSLWIEVRSWCRGTDKGFSAADAALAGCVLDLEGITMMNSPRFDHVHVSRKQQHAPAPLLRGQAALHCGTCRPHSASSRHPSAAVAEAVAVPAAGVHVALHRLQGGIAALSEALANVDKAAVKSLGISGQQHGFVPVDKDGEVSMEHELSTGQAACTHGPTLA